MEKVIATIVIIVLTLGLISYAIIGQIGGVKDTADQINNNQAKLSTVMKDTSIVPGSTVENYMKNAKISNSIVNVCDSLSKILVSFGEVNSLAEESFTYNQIDDAVALVEETSLYKMTKELKSDGSISVVTFVLNT